MKFRYISDSHMHTDCSFDGKDPATMLCERAVRLGFYAITITDHCECNEYREQEFDEAVDFFDWDRSRAWYMDIAHSDRDFIYAISKKNCKVFKKFINRGDEIYNRGREKYEELAFQWWLLTPKTA